MRAEPDAEPAPDGGEELLGFGVVGGSEMPDTEDVSVCMPLPTGDDGRVPLSAPRSTHQQGIGQSAGASIKESTVGAFGYKKSESLRPDLATGKPGAKLAKENQEPPGGPNVEEVKATAAANQERFVAAAVAGEVDDVQQLLGRAGVRIDGHVDQGWKIDADCIANYSHKPFIFD